ncbi:MAG: glycoside hydrolase family 70 protein [Streptococcus salivarius]
MVSEFLLANDIDNSNPAVQAEQLNWLPLHHEHRYYYWWF